MFRAISGAFTLLLTIMVMRLVLPEVSTLLVQIIVKMLSLVNTSLDQSASWQL